MEEEEGGFSFADAMGGGEEEEGGFSFADAMGGGGGEEEEGGFSMADAMGADDEEGGFSMSDAMGGGEDGEFNFAGAMGGEDDDDGLGGGGDFGGEPEPAAAPLDSVDLLASMMAGANMDEAMRNDEPEKEKEPEKPKKKPTKKKKKKDPKALMKAMKEAQNAQDAAPSGGDNAAAHGASAAAPDGGIELTSQIAGYLGQKWARGSERARDGPRAGTNLLTDSEFSLALPRRPGRRVPPSPLAAPLLRDHRKTITVLDNGRSVDVSWDGFPCRIEIEELLRSALKLAAGTEFHLVDDSGDSVVLSASIPSQLRFTVVAKAPPAPASNGKPAAAAPPRPGAAANGLSVVVPGDAGSAGEAVAADGDADALEMKKKPCCVVM